MKKNKAKHRKTEKLTKGYMASGKPGLKYLLTLTAPSKRVASRSEVKKRTLKEHSVQNSKLSHVMLGLGLVLMVTASQGRWRWER